MERYPQFINCVNLTKNIWPLLILLSVLQLGAVCLLIYYEEQDEVCTWIAYFYNWSGIVVFVFSVGIIVYLFYLVYHRTSLIRGNTLTTQKFLKSRSSRVALEIFYLISTLLLSCAYASIPYIHQWQLWTGWWLVLDTSP